MRHFAMESRALCWLLPYAAVVWALIATANAAGAPLASVGALKISGNVYLVESQGTNVAASVGEDGIVLVDTPDPKEADAVLRSLRNATALPVRYVINTHVHGDHVAGNSAFRKLAPIISHRNARRRLVDDAKQASEALPSITFTDELSLHINGEEIRLLSLPAGHTDGDVVVFFTRSNVVHMGDVFIPPAAAFVDRASGGTILGLIDALEYILPKIPQDVRIVPGHGSIATRADIVRGLEALKGMKAIIEKGIADQKSMEQLVADNAFDAWRGSTIANVPLDSYIGRFYRELSVKMEP